MEEKKQWEKKEEYKPEQTVFSAFHSDIEATGKRMCVSHSWRKRNEMEIECTNCPTCLIVGIDDERLLNA